MPTIDGCLERNIKIHMLANHYFHKHKTRVAHFAYRQRATAKKNLLMAYHVFVVRHGLQVSESLYKHLSHQQNIVCWSGLCH